MTSSAQLKYLDAMEIPVWVSRDIIQELEVNQVRPELISDPVTSSSSNNNVKAESSAQSILNSLDKTPSPPKTIIKDAITESVENTKLPDQSQSQAIQEPKGENLIFKSDQHYVFACGNENADWMIIGHSPERFNAIGQEPFAGEAGVLLENMIRSVGVENPRRDAYFINIFDFKNNKDRSSDVETTKLLNQQLTSLINKINPKLVLLVGQNAAQNLLNSNDPLIIMRSKIHQLDEIKIPCIVTYYPSYLLQKPIDKRKAWNDLKLAMSAINDVS